MEQDPQMRNQPNSFPVYSKSCFFKVHLVLEHSHKFKKNMDDFSTAFSKRVQAEISYHKNLIQCTKVLQKYIEPSSNKSVSFIASGFKVDNEQRAAQAMELANSLKSQVLEPIGQSIKEYTNLIKRIQKTTKRLSKDYLNYTQNYDRAYKSYKQNDNLVKQLIITKNIQRFTSEFSQDKKNKLISKTMQNIRQKSQYEKNYRTAVSQFNQLAQIYKKQTKESLDQIQLKERQLVKLQSDAIRKLIVCQVSMFKNVQYDLINISKQMEKVYPQSDIQQFRRVVQVQEESEKDRNLQSKITESDHSLLNLSLRNVEEQYYSWLMSIKKNRNIRKAVQIRLKMMLSKGENNQNQLKEQKQEMILKKEEQGKQVKKQQIQKQQIKRKQVQKQQEAQTKQNQGQNNDIKVQETTQFLQTEFDQLWQNIPKQIFYPPPHPLNIVQDQITTDEVKNNFYELSQIINDVWQKQKQQNSSAISQPRKSKQSVKSALRPKKKYKKFSNIINKNNLLRVLAYLFIQQYRIQHYVLIGAVNFQNIAQLISVLLDQAEEKKDVFTIKGMLGLLFTFYCIENQKHKKLLYQHSLIKDSDLWKKNDYWEASIFQSTYQQMSALTIQIGETQSETLLREKNIIFSQLASYCHYMLMLGVTSRQVRVIVGRYCRLYEMSDDQNRDLSRMISNTAKQIKEAQMIGQAKNQM